MQVEAESEEEEAKGQIAFISENEGKETRDELQRSIVIELETKAERKSRPDGQILALQKTRRSEMKKNKP